MKYIYIYLGGLVTLVIVVFIHEKIKVRHDIKSIKCKGMSSKDAWILKKYSGYFQKYIKHYHGEMKIFESYSKIYSDIKSEFKCKNVNDDALKITKSEILNKKNNLFNHDASNFFFNTINIIIVVSIAFGTIFYQYNQQEINSSNERFQNNINQMQLNTVEIKNLLSQIKYETETDNSKIQMLREEINAYTTYNNSLDNDSKNLYADIEQYRESLFPRPGYGYPLYFVILIYFTVAFFIQQFFKVREDDNINCEVSFLMLCILIIEDIEKERKDGEDINYKNAINSALTSFIETATTQEYNGGVVNGILKFFRKKRNR